MGRIWLQEQLFPTLQRRRVIGMALAASILAIIYWGIIASDRFVSEAHVIVQKTDLSGGQTADFASLLGGASINRADQLLLRDHLLSVDMLKTLDAQLDLRSHFSDWKRDPLSRMWFKDAPIEQFHNYYLTRASVEFDDYAGLLVIRAQAYDEQMAHAITTAMVAEGERHMNEMAHSLAQDQVAFLEKQVDEMGKRANLARQALLNFQNSKGMASPQNAAENLVGIINRLEGQLADMRTRRAAMLAYLMPNSPSVIEAEQQIAAVEKQIEQEQARLIAPGGKMLNSTVEEYQRLQMDAEFAQDIYKTALVALEQGRIEASRTLKKATLLQKPSMPQYPLEPRRLYNITVFILFTLLLAGITHLLAAIIRDHKD
ncbi:MAG: chain-length determining protein [Gammaproteobacteria bacterium]|nr:chain-length determining protein [Gammaproteobacteria bacterium]MBU1624483.1 chain-length determining protein [Gammaproteobacteria bacterium]MBU1982327.1 chain-length determining protein [Gammaproteobacteria bacterium]